MTAVAPSVFGPPTDSGQQEALAAMLGPCYAMEAADALGWFAAAGTDQVRGLWVDGAPVAALLRIPMGQHLGGRVLPMVGVAAVGVRLDARRRGHGSALMRAALAEMREEGAALSTLYASNMPLYRGVGYEAAGSAHQGEIRPTVIRAGMEGLRARGLEAADLAEVEAIQAGCAWPGALDRGPYIWSRVRARKGKFTSGLALVAEDGGIEGYLYARPESVGQARHKLVLTDVGARTPRAWRAAWAALADLGTMVEKISFVTHPADPFLLAQPHQLATVRLFECWMVRVLDAARLLEGRGYAPGSAGRVDLEVDDPLGLCGGRFRLEVEGGRGRLRPGGEGTVRMGPGGLATISTGFRSPAQAALLGLVEGPPEALDLLGGLLAGSAPWMRDLF